MLLILTVVDSFDDDSLTTDNRFSNGDNGSSSGSGLLVDIALVLYKATNI